MVYDVAQKKNKKKFKYFYLLNVKENKFLASPKFFFLKYCIFTKKTFLYKRSRFFFDKKNYLASEIAEMHFSFGDSDIPLRKTIVIVENYVIKFILKIISSICYISFWKTSKRPTVYDLLFFFRIKYLLRMKNLIQTLMGSEKKNQISERNK